MFSQVSIASHLHLLLLTFSAALHIVSSPSHPPILAHYYVQTYHIILLTAFNSRSFFPFLFQLQMFLTFFSIFVINFQILPCLTAASWSQCQGASAHDHKGRWSRSSSELENIWCLFQSSNLSNTSVVHNVLPVKATLIPQVSITNIMMFWFKLLDSWKSTCQTAGQYTWWSPWRSRWCRWHPRSQGCRPPSASASPPSPRSPLCLSQSGLFFSPWNFKTQSRECFEWNRCYVTFLQLEEQLDLYKGRSGKDWMKKESAKKLSQCLDKKS